MAGFMLFLRNPGEMVLENKGGIYIPPGNEIFIKLNKKKFERLGPRYGTCKDTPSLFNKNVSESVRECNQREHFEPTLLYCGCIPWYAAEMITNNFWGFSERNDELIDGLLKFFKSYLGSTTEVYLTDSEGVEDLGDLIIRIDNMACTFFKQKKCNLEIFRAIAEYKQWGRDEDEDEVVLPRTLQLPGLGRLHLDGPLPRHQLLLLHVP